MQVEVRELQKYVQKQQEASELSLWKVVIASNIPMVWRPLAHTSFPGK